MFSRRIKMGYIIYQQLEYDTVVVQKSPRVSWSFYVMVCTETTVFGVHQIPWWLLNPHSSTLHQPFRSVVFPFHLPKHPQWSASRYPPGSEPPSLPMAIERGKNLQGVGQINWNIGRYWQTPVVDSHVSLSRFSVFLRGKDHYGSKFCNDPSNSWCESERSSVSSIYYSGGTSKVFLILICWMWVKSRTLYKHY